jgi:hypothetical protein
MAAVLTPTFDKTTAAANLHAAPVVSYPLPQGKSASMFCCYKPCRREVLIADGMFTSNTKLREAYQEMDGRKDLPNLFFCSDTCCCMRKHELGIVSMPHDLYNRLLKEEYKARDLYIPKNKKAVEETELLNPLTQEAD